jgi:hypothetical protein
VSCRPVGVGGRVTALSRAVLLDGLHLDCAELWHPCLSPHLFSFHFLIAYFQFDVQYMTSRPGVPGGLEKVTGCVRVGRW